MRAADESRWLLWLGALAAVRAAVPLVALASGGLLPGFPPYSYEGPRGDASGYIDTARALISAGASYRLLLAGPRRGRCRGSTRGAVGVAPLPRRPPLGDRGLRRVCLVPASRRSFCGIEAQAPAGAVGWPAPAQHPAAAVPGDRLDRRRGRGRGRHRPRDRGEHRHHLRDRVHRRARDRQPADRGRRGGAVHVLAVPDLAAPRRADLGEQRLGDRGGTRALHRAGLDGVRRSRDSRSHSCVAARRGRPWRPGSRSATPSRCGRRTSSSRSPPRSCSRRSGTGAAPAGSSRAASAVLPIVLAFLPKKRGYDLELARDQTGLPLWSNDYLASTFTDSSVWRPLLLAVLAAARGGRRAGAAARAASR